MDNETGIFPRQPNGPTFTQKGNLDISSPIEKLPYANADLKLLGGDGSEYNPIRADDLIAAPYAVGHSFTLCPEEDLLRMTITSETAELKLYDGRMNHNNGWFVLSSELPCNVTKDAIVWTIRPAINEEWQSTPVLHISQVGYHPAEVKRLVIELDPRDQSRSALELLRVTPDGLKQACELQPAEWGKFLRYHHLIADFTNITEEGLYQFRYGTVMSNIFRIAKNIYDRGVWQPVLEYFLPVQMCHMLVREKYRVWHGRCHLDDATMAPLNYEQFDGAAQGPSTYCKYQPGDKVPGLDVGGWHDAGDFDLRIESQTGEMYILAAAYEAFHPEIDATTIDQNRKLVEIHQPDGRNDVLEQIEHGALSVIGAYRAMGRLYHEVMCGELRQYVLIGDPVNMTQNTPDSTNGRLVFNEDNPTRELTSAAYLAGASRALKDLNPELAQECLEAAKAIYAATRDEEEPISEVEYDPAAMGKNYTADSRIHAACELLISTGDDLYRQ